MKSEYKTWWRIIKIPVFAGSIIILIHIIFYLSGAPKIEPAVPVIMGFLLAAFLSEGINFINKHIDRRLSWKDKPIRRFMIQFGVNFGFFILLSVGLKLLFMIYVLQIDIKKIYRQEVIINAAITAIAFVVILGNLSFTMVRNWGYSLKELEVSKRQNVEFRYNTLIGQINPHFLFNSLNTLISLINEEPEKAMMFTRNLSQFFRNILIVQENDLIDIKQEILLAETYISLLKMRFGESLSICLDKDINSASGKVPCLVLQLLIENAVNHNVISQRSPLKVDIMLSNDHLVIKNNVQLKSSEFSSTKIGLKNIVERYRMETDKIVQIINADQEFIVKIPLLEQ